MTKDIAVIILAAGKGTRMKSPLPKVLHPVAGKSLIGYSLTSASDIGSKNNICVVGEGMSKVEDHVYKNFPSTKCVIQKEQLGTADAVKEAQEALSSFKGITLILYADTPFIQLSTLEAMIEQVEKKDSSVVVLGFQADVNSDYGRLITNDQEELEAIVEYKDASPEQKKIDFCNSGVMAVKNEELFELLKEVKNDNAKQEYYLTDIVAIARDRGLKCSVVKGLEKEVMGINSQAERAKAEEIAQNDLRNKAMEEGVLMVAPETVFLNADTEFGKGVVLHPNVVFGPGVKIGDGVEIKSFSHIEGATISDNVVIGPFARLRPGTDIKEEARIGNFVEVKKSVIGKGAKVNHLSYVGDSSVGELTNIGAGTITCNYDGFNKMKTEIGRGVFIGSNTSLVAPVKIGNEAIIGAGSTIIKDVDENSIAINEMPQKDMNKKAQEFRDDKVKG